MNDKPEVQRARTWLDAQLVRDRSDDKTFYQISADNLAGLLAEYAAHAPAGHPDMNRLFAACLKIAKADYSLDGVFSEESEAGIILQIILEALPAKSSVPAPPTPSQLDDCQIKIVQWGTECFGAEHMADHKVRALRLLEESIEFAQAVDAPIEQCTKLVEYVYSRPKGTPSQELGGVGVGWVAASAAIGISALETLRTEIERVLSKPRTHFTQRNQNKLNAGFDGAAKAEAVPPSPIGVPILDSFGNDTGRTAYLDTSTGVPPSEEAPVKTELLDELEDFVRKNAVLRPLMLSDVREIARLIREWQARAKSEEAPQPDVSIPTVIERAVNYIIRLPPCENAVYTAEYWNLGKWKAFCLFTDQALADSVCELLARAKSEEAAPNHNIQLGDKERRESSHER